MSKITLRLPTDVVKAAKHRAVDTDADLQEVVAEALRAFLKKGGSSAIRVGHFRPNVRQRSSE